MTIPVQDDPTTRRILVVDDSRTQRLLLRALLERHGYEVLEEADGAAALERLGRDRIQLLLSDWMMPGLTGPELCRAIRAGQGASEPYVYALLLTARHETDDLTEGLLSGADDFLSKPVAEAELIARLQTGRRLVAMQGRLIAERAALGAAHAELSRLCALHRRDLEMASRLQAEFVPPPAGLCNGAPCAAFHAPAAHVGGDLVGYFPVGRSGVGLYSIDVSGHGVAAALRAVQLAQLLGPADPAKNLAFRRGRHGRPEIRDPAETVGELNARCLGDRNNDIYFTMVLAVVDLETGAGRFCQAGHPPPAILTPRGEARLIGRGGHPVGMLPDLRFESQAFVLAPGERLVLYSDGLVEARRADGSMMEAERLAALFAAQAAVPVETAVRRALSRVGRETGGAFEDDVSAVMVERPRSRTANLA